MNEIDKFFGDLPSEDKSERNIFDEPNGASKVPEEGNVLEKGEGEGDGEARKNRRHRRLEEQLRKERESNIALNERVRVLAEVGTRQTGSGPSTDVPPEWIALYGDTPEAKTAWAMQDRMIKDATDRGKKEAIAEFESRQAEALKQTKEFESFIDNELEDLEDTFDVDLTSDAPAARKARKEFLELVQKVSPKDATGNITNYADFNSTFELYKGSKKEVKPDNSRQKEIAAKTMQGSSNGAQPQKQFTPGFRGWQKDYGIE